MGVGELLCGMELEGRSNPCVGLELFGISCWTFFILEGIWCWCFIKWKWFVYARILVRLKSELYLNYPQVYLLRKYASHHIPETGVRFFICSLSPYTIVYKVGSESLFAFQNYCVNGHFKTKEILQMTVNRKCSYWSFNMKLVLRWKIQWFHESAFQGTESCWLPAVYSSREECIKTVTEIYITTTAPRLRLSWGIWSKIGADLGSLMLQKIKSWIC